MEKEADIHYPARVQIEEKIMIRNEDPNYTSRMPNEFQQVLERLEQAKRQFDKSKAEAVKELERAQEILKNLRSLYD